MFLVVFKAKVKQLDGDYGSRAETLRKKAEQYGCLGFESYTQNHTDGEYELALSYWPDELSIKAWRQDKEHQEAQRLGRERYYEHFEVQVLKLERRYGNVPNSKGEH